MAQAPHKPTDEKREQVKALVVAGVNQPEIAAILGVSEPTLRKHYRADLDQALDRAIANVSNTLLQKALNGDTASAIFFLKVRGKKYGWTERQEITGADGGPIQTEDVTADADEFARRMARLAASDDEGGAGEAEPGGEGGA